MTCSAELLVLGSLVMLVGYGFVTLVCGHGREGKDDDAPQG